MSDPADIQLRNVSFAYNGQPVLEDVNLTIGSGEAICIVGPNGGGKTTLLKLILGLLRPDRGQVRLFGQPPRKTRLRIGYMPQHVRHDARFPVTVNDVVLMGRLGRRGLAGLFGLYSTEDRNAARDALAQLGMESYAHRPFAALSGGQRQRVLIARALCCRPDLLLLDEPTANVDTLVEARLFHILNQLNRRMTVVVVSHDLGFVSSLVGNVVCVNRRVVVHPTSEFDADAVRQLYGEEVRMVRHADILTETEGDA